MKISSERATVISNIPYEREVEVTVEESEIGSLIESLTHIYVDPIAAVMREYACNALDATIIAGSTEPVRITLPTVLNPNLVIEDRGVGMSADDFLRVFSKIGKSTKRDTNDQVGAFGIGSKSAFAIASQFIIASVKDGEKNVIVVTKNENNIPELKFLPTEHVNDRNGTTVTIPAAPSAHFNELASTLFLGWKPGTVTVNGAFIGGYLWDDTHYTRYTDGWVKNSIPRSGYRFYRNNIKQGHQYSFKAILGPVTYDVPLQSVFDYESEETVAYLNGVAPLVSDIVVQVNIGEASVVRSRDSFLFNSATKKKLRELFSSVVADFQADKRKLVAAASSRSEAFQLAYEMFNQLGINVNPEWKGEAVPLALDDPYDTKLVSTIVGTSSPVTLLSKVGSNPWEKRPYNAASVFASTQQYKRGSVTRHPILITGAPEKAVKEPMSGTWRSVARYAFSDALKDNQALNLFLTTESAENLSPWHEVISDRIMAFDDMLALGKQERSRLDRIARQTRKNTASAAAKQGKQTPLVVKRVKYNDQFSNFRFTRADVNAHEYADKKVIYVQFHADATTVQQKYENKVYDLLTSRATTNYWSVQYDQLISSFLFNWASLDDTPILLIPRAVKVEKVVQALPNAETWSAAVERLSASLDSISDSRWQIITTSSKVADFAKTINLDDLTSESVREYFKTLTSSKQVNINGLRASSKMLADKWNKIDFNLTASRNATRASELAYLTPLAEKVIAVSKEKVAPRFDFPLLDSLSYTVKSKDVVDYINLVSQAQKA